MHQHLQNLIKLMLGKRYNNNSSKKRKHISFVFIIKIIDRSRGGFEKNKQCLST